MTPASPSPPLRLTVPEGVTPLRLDQTLGLPEAQSFALSRSRFKVLILSGAVQVDGVPVHDPAHKVTPGRVIEVQIPEIEPATPRAENIPLTIVYEDEDLLVLDKPPGLVVHPGAGHGSGTLVHALLHHCGNSLSGIGGVARPGIVHRLDRETSGLMIVAKTDQAHRALAAQLADRTLSRTYHTLVLGEPSAPAGRIETRIGRHPTQRLKMAAGGRDGRMAATRYRVISSYGKKKDHPGAACSLVACSLETGRTHQIRVHMAHIHHPVIGDPLYGPQVTALRAALKKSGYDVRVIESLCAFPRQALHAVSIGFVHPRTHETLHFESPLPADMAALITLLTR